jgi:hypothetical protein
MVGPEPITSICAATVNRVAALDAGEGHFVPSLQGDGATDPRERSG